MKIIHVAHQIESKDNPITTAFKNRGLEVLEVDWYDYIFGKTRHNADHFSRYLLGIVESYQPDLIFMQIQSAGIITEIGLHDLTKKAPTIAWTGDVRDDISWQVKACNAGVLSLCNNMHDIFILRGMGYKNADYLQIGFHTEIHRQTDEMRNRKKEGVCFLANYYPEYPNAQDRMLLAMMLRGRFGNLFALYGLHWPKHVIDEVMPPVDMFHASDTLNNYKISINHSNFTRGGYTSDRLFYILGSGTFCLSHQYPEIEKEFEIGKHLITYKTVRECVDLCEYWMHPDRDEERAEIALAGMLHVHQNCTWDNRINDLAAIVNQYYNLTF